MEGAGIADLQAHIEGALDIVGGDGGAVAPLGGGIDLHGQLGLLGVPAVVSVSQQGNHLAGEEVIHIERLEHDGAGAGGAAGNGHGVVLIGSHGVPAVHLAPLLAAEVQGLVAGQVAAGSGGFGGGGFRGLGGFRGGVGGLGSGGGRIGVTGRVVVSAAAGQQAQSHYQRK